MKFLDATLSKPYHNWINILIFYRIDKCGTLDKYFYDFNNIFVAFCVGYIRRKEPYFPLLSIDCDFCVCEMYVLLAWLIDFMDWV